tara:strand:- start:1483 stop:1830 length:348 start_codon:yes stop_codon:yes gene_type:complete
MIRFVFPATKPILDKEAFNLLGGISTHTMRRNLLPPDGDVEKGVDQKWSIGALSGIWFQPPRKVSTGEKAKIQWWHRLRSLVLIVCIVVGGGIAVAAVLGAGFFAAGFLLEQFIG